MSRQTFIRSLKISQPSGVDVNINLFLSQKPIREEQKLKTLTKYVQRYPTGWKKRLELADLLYSMGKWTEAIEEYRQVIERQPQLIPVRLKLGKILQLIGREKEAIEIYESALSLFSNLKFPAEAESNFTQFYRATESHIIGLIEVCRQNFPKAIEAFSSATNLESNNPSHWLALGQVQRVIGNNLDALRAFETILSHYPDDIIALVNTYDTLIALGKTQTQLSSDFDDTNDNLWYKQAKKSLDQAIALAPDNYQIVKRQLSLVD